MSYIISVYSNVAFKEFLLPAVNNSECTIILNKKLFRLDKDIELMLEIVEDQWSFISTSSYEVLKDGTPFCGIELIHGDLLEILTIENETVYALVSKRENYFAVFDKLDLRKISKFSIGKNNECAIRYDGMGLVSRLHANMIIQEDQAFLEDKSANGTFVNSERISGTVRLEYGDHINIYGLRMVYLGDILAVCTAYDDVFIDWSVFDWYEVSATNNVNEIEKPKIFFHRAPRKIWKVDQSVIEIEAPPSIKEQQKQSLFMMIGPALTMSLPMILGCGLAIYSSRLTGSTSGAFMYTGLITAFSSALIGVFWTLINQSQSKKKNKEEESRRFEAYSQYLIKCTDTIREKYEKNMNALKNMYLDSTICCRYNVENPNLWGRNSRQSDFLTHRLGVGELPFQVKITIPREKFNLVNDSLNSKPAMIHNEYSTLYDVPICVDLYANRLIGVVGGEDKKGAYDILRILSAQIASNNAYTEVKLVYLMEESSGEDVISYAKWFPHVWSEDRKTRYVSQNRLESSEVLYELAKILRTRSEESNYNNNKKIPKPYYIIFIDNVKILEGEPIAKYLFEAKQEYGISTFLLASEYEELPNECEYIIRNDSEFSGIYRTEDDIDDRIQVKFDLITDAEVEELARTLSSIELNEIELGGEIPSALTFFEMYGISSIDELNIMERWKKNRNYDSMKALIGQKSGGAPCFLDVHEKYHGPHGLVAGTTGSGKSETLQTYILSLALNFSPDDVGFFVIDYKGGGMSNLFEGLPHMIGQISNLSGNQVRRAMVSIKSENMRRQRLFNEHGVNNINLYTKLYKNNEASVPIPHMFIIIDEFAELKREEPEFMRELISVAQVGRSLGVHLILATQKPSGTVDDNIWSNSKFKLCLRVQDKQDSNDMLHKPDAAYITQAGRCYLQVGNDEIYELFQSGWSGATYSKDNAEKSEVAKLLSLHGRTAIIGNKSKIEQKEKSRENWLEGLLYIVDGALRDAKTSAKECVANPTIAQKIILDIFERLENANISYPQNDYNIRRLEDLINLFTLFPVKQEYGIPATANQFILMADREQKKLPEEKEKTQLDAVVECLSATAQNAGYKSAFQLWLPVLPKTIYLSELNGYKEHVFNGNEWPILQGDWNLEVLIGLYDDPVNQSQKPVSINFSQNGHYAVCGMVVSGKSTLLQTIVFFLIQKYTPQYINLYMIDFSSKMLSCFENAPHVGGVMYENEIDKIDKFFTMMMGILEQRKNLLKGGNYGQFVQSQGVSIPAIFIVIDNYAGFKEKTAGIYENLVLQLSRDGAGYGIYLLISSAGFGASEIPNRIGDNIRNVICLEMSDKFQYGDALRVLHVDVIPESDIRGRGLASVGSSILEFQTALAIHAGDDYDRVEQIKGICSHMSLKWDSDRARKIPEIPEKVIWGEFEKLYEVLEMSQNGQKLPIGYHMKNASVYGIELANTYCFLISGKSKTGKSNFLKTLIKSAYLQEAEICVIDTSIMELEETAKIVKASYITNDQQMFQFWETLIPIFAERNKMKKEYISQGLDDDEIFKKMLTLKKYFIFIADLNRFINSIENPESGVGNMKGFMENITDKGHLHNIYFFGCMNSDDRSLTGKIIFENFTRDKKGIHFGGNIQAQRIFSVDGISFQEQTKTYKAGIGMLADLNESEPIKVVVPYIRGV